MPGMALLGACLVARPLNGRLARPRALAPVLCAICLLAFAGADWPLLRNYVRNGRADRSKYLAMLSLRNTNLAIVPATETWPAHYIHQCSGGGADNPRWVIYWPTWDSRSGSNPPPEWVAENLAAGRRIAVSPTAADRARRPIQTLLREIAPGLKFQKHPCGWWISEKPG
jgi:hypothetical protein